MSNIAIIAEYNPFHNGHKLHVEEAIRLAELKARAAGAEAGEGWSSEPKSGGTGVGEACQSTPKFAGRNDHCVIAIMSGDFTQRGHLAVYSKWKRAEAAVRCGVDLVLELPVWAACGGADLFAAGGVGLAEKLGNIDFLAFGAENSGEDLMKASRLIADEDESLSSAIKAGLDEGKSFAKARAEAVAATGYADTADLLSKPNNILGVEYLKHLIRLGSQIEPLVVNRRHAGYFEESEEGFAGAGLLREKMTEGMRAADLGAYIPEEAIEVIGDEEPVFMDAAFKLIEYKLMSEDRVRLAEIDGAVEGLENRAVKAAYQAIDYESLVEGIKSKRYSRTAVERLLVRTLLGIKKEDVADFRKAEGGYARVLAFNNRGAAYLKDLKDNENITVISNVSKEAPNDRTLEKMLELDVRAADIYDLIKSGSGGAEKKSHAIKI